MTRIEDFRVGSSPEESVQRGARSYTLASGLSVPDADYGRIVMPRSTSAAMGRAHDRMPAFDPAAVPAYKQMREETMRQFEHMTKPTSRGGMGLSVESQHDDPYGRSSVHDIVGELRGDVRRGKVKVLSTEATGGHPFFSNDENDAFRAVHDVFGHLGSGRGVDRHGEEAAYRKHAAMFSPLARQAMATETRGQNSALHLHGEFPEQKVGLLPATMQGLQFRAPAHEIAAAADDARLENRKQGLA